MTATLTWVQAMDRHSDAEIIEMYESEPYKIRRETRCPGRHVDYDEQLTALHNVVEHNRPALVEYLVKKKGFNVDAQNKHGETPLAYTIALHTCAYETIEALIRCGATIDCKGSNLAFGEQLPLLALAVRDVRALELLLKAGAKPNYHIERTSAYTYAFAQGKCEAMVLLVRYGAERGYIQKDLENLFLQPDLVMRMIDAGVCPTNIDWRKLFNLGVWRQPVRQSLEVLWLAGYDMKKAFDDYEHLHIYNRSVVDNDIERAGVGLLALTAPSFSAETETRLQMLSNDILSLQTANMCIALQGLDLPALMIVEILQEMVCDIWPMIKFHCFWNLAVVVKHFHTSPEQAIKKRRKDRE